jgi:hypothetical protein
LNIRRTDGQLTAAGLDGITALPDHGDDGAAEHVLKSVSTNIITKILRVRLTGDEAGEEGLVLEVGVVLLELSTGRGGELHGSELEARMC